MDSNVRLHPLNNVPTPISHPDDQFLLYNIIQILIVFDYSNPFNQKKI